MTSLRKFFYAGLLALGALSVPAPASAQELAHGQFILPHEVHWQRALVPAGEYRFIFESNGATGVLTLTKMDGARAGFLFLVTDTEQSQSSEIDRILLDKTPRGSVVTDMQLPKCGLTLHFSSGKSAGREVAAAGIASSMSAE